MKNKLILFCTLVAGCNSGCTVKFEYLNSLSNHALVLTSPSPSSVYSGGSVITAIGNCFPSGGPVTLSGTLVGATVYNTGCLPDGSFNTDITTVGSGEGYELDVSQTDEEGNVQVVQAPSIDIHCAGPAMQSCAVSGSGSVSNPYGINSISCLQEMRTGMTCSYELVSNIDATATSSWNSGAGWDPVGQWGSEFTGTVDGNGFSISNLFRYYVGGGLVETGLLGSTNGATISNIKFDNINFHVESGGLRGVAAVVGWAYNTTINNVSVTGQLTGGDNIGSLVGRADSVTINNSYSSANLNEVPGVTSRMGGLVGGFNNGVVINNSYYSGTITTGSVYLVGGIAACFDNYGLINNSFMAGTLTQTSGNAGSLLGYADASVDIINSPWFTYSGLAVAVAVGTPNTNDSPTVGSVNYFHNITNAPLDLWDFSGVWTSNGSSLPTLR